MYTELERETKQVNRLVALVSRLLQLRGMLCCAMVCYGVLCMAVVV
jgi:hypothetical protein